MGDNMNEKEFEKAQNKQIETMKDIARNSIGHAVICDKNCDKCGIVPLCTEREQSVIDSEDIEAVISMESAERIEITFKSGETISYGKGEWDDYAYDGKAVIVKKNSTWIGIYNFDNVFCVELK